MASCSTNDENKRRINRKRKAICNAVIGLLMLLGSSIASGIQLHRKKTWTSTTGEKLVLNDVMETKMTNVKVTNPLLDMKPMRNY